jgi:hypothetical protein
MARRTIAGTVLDPVVILYDSRAKSDKKIVDAFKCFDDLNSFADCGG